MSNHLADHAEQLQRLCQASDILRGLRAVVARGGIELLREDAATGDAPSSWRLGRLTPTGGDQYGLSIVRHTGRLEKVPFSGTVSMLCETMEGPLAHVFGDF